MVSYTSGGKSSSSSAPVTNLPWRETRGLMKGAKERFVDPFLRGDLTAPAVKTGMNIARNESSKATGELIGELVKNPTLSTPMKGKLANDAMGKIAELAAGAGIKSFQELAAWFDKVTGSMGQMSNQKATSGSSYGIGTSGTAETLKALSV